MKNFKKSTHQKSKSQKVSSSVGLKQRLKDRKNAFIKGQKQIGSYFESFDSFNDNIDQALAILKGEQPTEAITVSKRDFYKDKILQWAQRIKK